MFSNKMKIYDGCLPSNFRMIVAGASSSGKSTLITKLLENKNGILDKDFERVVYLRGVPTKNEEVLKEKFGKGLLVFNGIPPKEVLLPLCSTGVKTVLVIEDLDSEACSSPLISKIFTAYSHHNDFSVILSTQNIFRPGSERLTLIRNSTHVVLFPNNLDLTVVRYVAFRVYPENPKTVVRLFEKVTAEPYQYLSLWSGCPTELKFRSHITEEVQKVYDLS